MKTSASRIRTDLVDALRRTLPLALIFSLGVATAHAQRIALPDQRLQMLDCWPSSYYVSCFRLKLNAENVPLQDDLVRSLTVHIDDKEITPFYASVSGAETRARTALILVDVSGSMNYGLSSTLTRFQAAKAAVKEFLKTFVDGKDRVAIVPFESHGVKDKISSAQFFTTQARAMEEADGLKEPKHCKEGKDCPNTALYSAVDLGLAALLEQRTLAASDSALLLVVLTDGYNDVDPKRGDESGLIEGTEVPTTLVNKIRDAVRNYNVRVISLGVGKPSEVDLAALRQLSSEKPVPCQDPECLKDFFAQAGAGRITPIVAAFDSPWGERVSAATRTARVRVLLRSARNETLDTGEALLLWSAPEIGLPLFEAKCIPAEHSALLKQSPDPPSLLSLLDPVLVFVGFGVALLVLWYGLPRLIWGDRTIVELQLAEAGRRWGGAPTPPPKAEMISRNATPATGVPTQSPQRTSVEGTQAQLIHETGTRTRLEKVQRAEDNLKR